MHFFIKLFFFLILKWLFILMMSRNRTILLKIHLKIQSIISVKRKGRVWFQELVRAGCSQCWYICCFPLCYHRFSQGQQEQQIQLLIAPCSHASPSYDKDILAPAWLGDIHRWVGKIQLQPSFWETLKLLGSLVPRFALLCHSAFHSYIKLLPEQLCSGYTACFCVCVEGAHHEVSRY